MKTVKEQEEETEKKIARFWDCFNAIKDLGCDGKMAYSEATRQLGYSPPPTGKFLKKY